MTTFEALESMCTHPGIDTVYDLEFDVDPSRCVNPCSLDFLLNFHGVRTGMLVLVLFVHFPYVLSFFHRRNTVIQDFDMEQGRLLILAFCYVSQINS